MAKLFKDAVNTYYDKKINKYQGTWKQSYYEYLRDFSTKDNWKKVVKPRIKKSLATDKYNVANSPLKKKWYYIKFRLQMILFGVRDDEFFTMGFCQKPFFNPREAMTKGRVFWLDTYLNDIYQNDWIGDKAVFAELIGDELFGRKWSRDPISESEFEDKFGECKRVIVKPLTRFGGRGINVFNVEDAKQCYAEICAQYKEGYIIEEYFEQKGFMHELNPSSLNTIRVISIREPGTTNVHILDAYARVGVGGALIDNYSSGGVTYDLDMATGTIGTGRSKAGGYAKVLTTHPGTGESHTGKKIPHWEEVLEACRKCHCIIPERLDFIGWDVCLSDDKITFVEANSLAGFGRTYGNKRDRKWAKLEKILNNCN